MHIGCVGPGQVGGRLQVPVLVRFVLCVTREVPVDVVCQGTGALRQFESRPYAVSWRHGCFVTTFMCAIISVVQGDAKPLLVSPCNTHAAVL